MLGVWLTSYSVHRQSRSEQLLSLVRSLQMYTSHQCTAARGAMTVREGERVWDDLSLRRDLKHGAGVHARECHLYTTETYSLNDRIWC